MTNLNHGYYKPETATTILNEDTKFIDIENIKLAINMCMKKAQLYKASIDEQITRLEELEKEILYTQKPLIIGNKIR